MTAPTAARRSSWKILLPLLAATLAAVAWLEFRADPADEVAGAVVRPRASEDRPRAPAAARAAGEGTRTDGSAQAEALRIERVPRQPGGSPGSGDPFARADWNPPPPKPRPATVREVAPEPPPKPVAPPIPYSYFGMSIQDGRTVVFVTRGERTFVLAVGEVIENLYRVEEIRPPDVILTYLPLNERQVMKIGTVQP